MHFDARVVRVMTAEVHRRDCLSGPLPARTWSEEHCTQDQAKAVRILEGLAAAGYRLTPLEGSIPGRRPATNWSGRNGCAGCAGATLLQSANPRMAVPDGAAVRSSAIRPTLPDHQMQTLQLIAAGAPDRQLARRMDVSVDAAKSRVKALLRMFGAQNRAHVVALAYQAGVLWPERIDMSWLPATGVPVADLVAGRSARGISQVQLAGLLGVSPDWLTMRESGRRPFTVAVARRYADLVGVDLNGGG